MYLSQPTLTYQVDAAEDELKFKIFDRSQKNVSITPAGKMFIDSLRIINGEYKKAVEQAQNYSDKYSDDIVISLPYRSAIHLLPQAIKEMAKVNPSTWITPKFGWTNRLNDFLNGDVDILFGDYEALKNIKGIKIIHFYQSRIYLVCNKDDPLAAKKVIHSQDLLGRTLMVGGGSQRQLKIVQERVLNEVSIPFFNSDDHDTTLTNVAADKAVVLAPGFLHERSDGFVWIPFDCHEMIDCCLATKEQDNRKIITDFIDILMDLYRDIDLLSL